MMPTSTAALDESYMRRALDLAARAQGRTFPNPMVGCVVLDSEGSVCGEGFHPKAGEPHAEVFALNEAKERARGGTLYVNLEPCCHHGRTPPCVDKVLASGVKRVVVGSTDSNAKVDGGGLRALRQAGVEVVQDVLAFESRYLNRGFFKAHERNLPWLSLKMAGSLDGRIADRDGKSRYITSASALAYVQQLRAKEDCIMVGANTARLDDPKLTARLDEGEITPVRVVIDSRLTISPQARIFASPGRVILFCAKKADQTGFKNSAEIYKVETSENGRLDLTSCLQKLAELGIRRVLCEGGGQLAGSLIDSDLVDEFYWFVAPKILVDEAALPAVASRRARPLADCLELKRLVVEPFAPDVLFHGLAPGGEMFLQSR